MIGKWMMEALGEGAFLGVLKNAWGWAIKTIGFLGVGDVIGKGVTDEIKKRFIDPKGWGDENYFALDLAEANLSADKKTMISKAVKQVEDEDASNGTSYARNFRIVVTFNDETHPSKPAVPGVAATPAVPARAAVPATATTAAILARSAIPAKPAIPAVPATFRPGIIIMEDLGKCDNAVEVYTRIMAVGVMQSEVSSFEKFLIFANTTIIPFLKRKGTDWRVNADISLIELEVAAKQRHDKFQKRSFLSKFFLN